jgi:hypothetical protein
MSWLYSQALVEEYSAANCLDGEQSAPLSGSHTQQAYCAPDKMTAFSRLSRFGMTYKPLMENLGQELLTLYLAGFHAKTSAQQEEAQELMENDQECGEKWHASFTKYDLDSSLWRTHQCLLLGGLEEFSETWPQWGLMRDGECWEQQTLEQNIRGTGFGSSLNTWATPTTMDKLPPKSAKALHKEATMARPGRSKPTNLRDQVSNMQNWPTPDASPRGPTKDYDPKAKSQSGRTLQSFVAKFPTPQASDHRDRGNMSNPSVQRRVDIGKQISLSQSVHPTSGQLNPTWVEWLMGWPLGWTDLKPLEMGKSHCAQQPHGESLQKDN